MSATRSSRKAARSFSLPVTGDFFRFFGVDVEGLCYDLDILIAAAGEVHDQVLAGSELLRHLLGVEDRVRGFERRDDSLEPGTQGKSSERLLVGDARVLDQPLVLEVGVLGTDGGIVEAGGDRVRLSDLALFGLEDVAQGTVQHAGAPAGERGPVIPRLESPPGGLHTRQ